MSMYQRGYQIISDDICSIHETDQNFYANTGVPQLKIWRDVIDNLGVDEVELKVREGIEKYIFPITSNDSFLKYQIKNIVSLISSNVNEFKCDEIIGANKVPILLKNTYRPDYLEGLEIYHLYVEKISKLANNVRIFEITRPSKPLLINELANFLEEKLL